MTFMPFGKHKGAPLYQIPAYYLKWCLRTIDLRPKLRDDIEAELVRRESGAQQKIDDGIRINSIELEGRPGCGCANCIWETSRILDGILKARGIKLAKVNLSRTDIQISEAS